MKSINNSFKKSISTIATAGAIGLAAIAAGNALTNGSNVAAATTQTISVSVNSATVYDAPAGHATGKTVAKGTNWKAFSSAKDSSGHVWFNVGGDQWIGSGSVAIVPTNTSSDAVQSVISLAQKQIGKPYVWGAKGPSSFDCSGLMHYVFANAANKEIGGWTVPQESAGTKVSINNLQAGDLIFWGNAGSTYHVALYIGNGQYIHAPKPGDHVKVASISKYFMPSFGVRVL